MKTADLFESFSCKLDEKARRRSNVAPSTKANITADQLEDGMTLEALQEIGVPVLVYQTQLTIHGLIPEFDDSKRIGGYRSLIRNGNGSIGVKFGAVDIAKKDLIFRACKSNKNSVWGAGRDSNGLTLQKIFKHTEKQAAIDFAMANKDVAGLVYGSLYGVTLAWGSGYAVCLSVGAIPQANLWEFIAAVSGIKTETELLEKEAEREAEREAQRAETRAYLDNRNKEIEAENQVKLAELMKTAKLATGEPIGNILIVKSTGGFIKGTITYERKRFYWKSDEFYTTKKQCKEFPFKLAITEGRVFTV